MKHFVTFLLIAAFAATALAADIAKDPRVTTQGVYTYHPNQNNRGDVAVVSIIDGTFTDLGPTYQAALNANGHSADLYYDPHGSVAYGTYSFILVDSSDLWWSYDWTAEINAWITYMDGGGTMALVGQDYLWSSGSYSFPQTYLGMQSALEDLNYSDTGALTWTGTDVLAGLNGSMTPCFADNPWFTDQVMPTMHGVATWSSPLSPTPVEGGCASMTGMFSAVEFGCGSNVNDVVGAFLGWLVPTASERSNISKVKSKY